MYGVSAWRKLRTSGLPGACEMFGVCSLAKVQLPNRHAPTRSKVEVEVQGKNGDGNGGSRSRGISSGSGGGSTSISR